VVLAIGLVTIFLRGDRQKARGFDKLILLHFTLTEATASIVPAWIPWHQFWVYFVGTCFIAAALSLVTRIQARLSASLLALTFFLFVMLMDAPGWARNPRDRFALTFALRELSFSGGPLALAASLTEQSRERLIWGRVLSKDVSITNITMRDVSAPIFLRLGRRMCGPSGVPVGALRRVIISNLVCSRLFNPPKPKKNTQNRTSLEALGRPVQIRATASQC
jgi:hypothetical protein